jgi:hypothetical protein
MIAFCLDHREGAAMNEMLARRCLEMLRIGDLTGASNCVVDHEASQSSPRGLGVVWRAPEMRVANNLNLVAVFEAQPTILNSLSPEDMCEVRVRAGMLELFGLARAPKWMGLPEIIAGQMDTDAAARMLLFSASTKRKLLQYQTDYIGIARVEIDTAPDSCPSCELLSGTIYHIGDTPELPHPDCTNEYGCRCDFRPLLDEPKRKPATKVAPRRRVAPKLSPPPAPPPPPLSFARRLGRAVGAAFRR